MSFVSPRPQHLYLLHLLCTFLFYYLFERHILVRVGILHFFSPRWMIGPVWVYPRADQAGFGRGWGEDFCWTPWLGLEWWKSHFRGRMPPDNPTGDCLQWSISPTPLSVVLFLTQKPKHFGYTVYYVYLYKAQCLLGSLLIELLLWWQPTGGFDLVFQETCKQQSTWIKPLAKDVELVHGT